jgi:hypothetical protein
MKFSLGRSPLGDYVCHSFVKEGMIEFLSDCTHDMKNKTVELPDYPVQYLNNNDSN